MPRISKLKWVSRGCEASLGDYAIEVSSTPGETKPWFWCVNHIGRDEYAKPIDYEYARTESLARRAAERALLKALKAAR